MSAHHYNQYACHDEALWRWDAKERRWVRITDNGEAWMRVGWGEIVFGELLCMLEITEPAK